MEAGAANRLVQDVTALKAKVDSWRQPYTAGMAALLPLPS